MARRSSVDPFLRGMVRVAKNVVKEVEKSNRRQQRETEKAQRQQQKLHAAFMQAEQAETTAARWEHNLITIQSLHAQCSDPHNWKKRLQQPLPQEPTRLDDNEQIARKALDRYTPSFFDKALWEPLFSSVTKKRASLENAVIVAHAKDEEKYQEEMGEYRRTHERIQTQRLIAQGVIDKKPQSYEDAIKRDITIKAIPYLGKGFNIICFSDWLDIDLEVNDDAIIPKERLSATSTGKLSKRAMPVSRINEIYQDHVCSACLRIAREFFALLPIDYVRVNAVRKAVDTATGHLGKIVILSAIMPRKTLRSLNMSHVDPSDCIRNFAHTMDFKKSTGFAEVSRVEIPDQLMSEDE